MSVFPATRESARGGISARPKPTNRFVLKRSSRRDGCAANFKGFRARHERREAPSFPSGGEGLAAPSGGSALSVRAGSGPAAGDVPLPTEPLLSTITDRLISPLYGRGE